MTRQSNHKYILCAALKSFFKLFRGRAGRFRTFLSVLNEFQKRFLVKCFIIYYLGIVYLQRERHHLKTGIFF